VLVVVDVEISQHLFLAVTLPMVLLIQAVVVVEAVFLAVAMQPVVLELL
jgi:hypothetical protein